MAYRQLDGLIHMRLLGGSVQDWLALYRNVFTSLIPGTGHVEHIEIDKPYKYMGPVDDEELDRLDIFHKFFSLTREHMGLGELHISPLPKDRPIKVLDLGCGTGIWCIDMAHTYENAQIVGWDLNKTQPEVIDPNLRYEQRDISEPKWLIDNSMD